MAFPTTRWTMIRQAAAAPSADSRQALEMLCQTYVDPVLGYVRRKVRSLEAAEDVTQQFFARLIDGPLLQRADPQIGRFRAFLLNALRDFLADVHDYEHAKKRGGDRQRVSLSAASAEPRHELTPDTEFELQWIRSLLNSALQDLELEYSSAKKSALFDQLKLQLDTGARAGTQELAERLKMSDAAVRVALHRMRNRLGELIRQRIADTVPTAADVDEELLKLRQVLEQAR